MLPAAMAGAGPAAATPNGAAAITLSPAIVVFIALSFPTLHQFGCQGSGRPAVTVRAPGSGQRRTPPVPARTRQPSGSPRLKMDLLGAGLGVPRRRKRVTAPRRSAPRLRRGVRPGRQPPAGRRCHLSSPPWCAHDRTPDLQWQADPERRAVPRPEHRKRSGSTARRARDRGGTRSSRVGHLRRGDSRGVRTVTALSPAIPAPRRRPGESAR